MKTALLQGLSVYEVAKQINRGHLTIFSDKRSHGWSVLQMEKLMDSLLSGYPLGAFIFFGGDEGLEEELPEAVFPTEAVFSSKEKPLDVLQKVAGDGATHSDLSVLDGAQRLFTFYLALFGRLNKEEEGRKIPYGLFVELDRKKIGDGALHGKNYALSFEAKDASLSPTAFEVRRMLEDAFMNPATHDAAFAEVLTGVPKESKVYAVRLLNRLYNELYVEKRIYGTRVSGLGTEEADELHLRLNSHGSAL